MEGENAEMVQETSALRQDKESLKQEVAESAEKVDDLKDEIRSLERDLSRAKDDIVRAQKARSVETEPVDSGKLVVSQTFVDEVIKWAHKYSTLAFPVEVSVVQEPVTLMDRSQQVQVPVSPGGKLRATRFHPSAKDYIVVAQLNSDKLLATVKIDNISLAESLASKYTRHMNSMGHSVKNPYERKTLDKSTGSFKSMGDTSGASFRSSKSSASVEVQPTSSGTLIQSKALMPQKDEDFLKATAPGSMTSSQNDHGTGCVCKDCRAKKIGKGSLFPE